MNHYIFPSEAHILFLRKTANLVRKRSEGGNAVGFFDDGNAWGLFAVTGGLGYYMLYKALHEDKTMEELEREQRE